MLCRAAQLIKIKIDKNQSIHREATPRHYKIRYLSRNSFSPTRCSPELCPPTLPRAVVHLRRWLCRWPCRRAACSWPAAGAGSWCWDFVLRSLCFAWPLQPHVGASCKGKKHRRVRRTAGLTKKTPLLPFCLSLLQLLPQHGRRSSPGNSQDAATCLRSSGSALNFVLLTQTCQPAHRSWHPSAGGRVPQRSNLGDSDLAFVCRCSPQLPRDGPRRSRPETRLRHQAFMAAGSFLLPPLAIKLTGEIPRQRRLLHCGGNPHRCLPPGDKPCTKPGEEGASVRCCRNGRGIWQRREQPGKMGA